MDSTTNIIRATEKHEPDHFNQSSESSSDRVDISGTPYVHPSFEFVQDDSFERLDGWDRTIVFAGGCVLGFSIGASTALCLFANVGESFKSGLFAGSVVGFLSVAVCTGIYIRTQRLFSELYEKLNADEANPPS